MTAGSTNNRPHLDLPPSGPRPVFSLAPPTDPQRLRTSGDVSPATETERPLWFRRPHHKRRPSQAPVAAAPADDAELGGVGGLEDPEKDMICGCSKANFIIIVFFMVVLLAAALGGGVGGSLFAAKRDDDTSSSESSA